MISRLLSGYDVICTGLTATLPRTEVLQVKNRLMSGAIHIQTIGSGAEVLDVEAVVDGSGRETLALAYAAGEELRVEADGHYWLGVIDGDIKWSVFRKGNSVKRRHSAAFTLAVTEAGEL